MFHWFVPTILLRFALKPPSLDTIQHLAIDATGLKVRGEGEGKVKKHGTDGKRRVWRKHHLAVDTYIYEIIAAELTLSSETDAEVLPNLLKQTRRVIKAISGYGAYNTRECHRATRVKKVIPLIPLRQGAALWIKGASTQSGGWVTETLCIV